MSDATQVTLEHAIILTIRFQNQKKDLVHQLVLGLNKLATAQKR